MPKNVWRMRITLDSRYPNIVASCASAIESVADRHAGTVRRPTWLEIYNDWKHWPCVVPQGEQQGPKHKRPIELTPWQNKLVEAYPQMLLRGLIESDGCRAINRISHFRGGETVRYEYVRYFFSNVSADIRGIFATACDLAGVEWRPDGERNISVARRGSVALLDSFIGPKS